MLVAEVLGVEVCAGSEQGVQILWKGRTMGKERTVDFETAVVYMAGGICAHEEGVVVSVGGADVYVHKHGYVFALAVLAIHVQKVGGCEVEHAGVEVELRGKVLHAEAVVAQLAAQSQHSPLTPPRLVEEKGGQGYLVHRGRARLEPLEARHPRFLHLVVRH